MVLVVAHRGSNADLPEHSLAAYLRALTEGADAVECDVRLTDDGTAVLIHDRDAQRTTGIRRVISKATLGQLMRVDWSYERQGDGAEFSSPDASGLLTLRRLLLAVAERSPSTSFSIETKHPTRYRGYVEREVVDVLRSVGMLHGSGSERVRVMSFSVLALLRMRRLAPQIPRVYLMDGVYPWRRNGSLPADAYAAGISIEALLKDPGYVERVHARGAQVHVWVVDTAEHVQACLDAGVDALISNRPGMVRGVLEAAGIDTAGS